MNIEKMREEFEAYRDKRNAQLEEEGHAPGSKWHVTNAHYPTWQQSRASLVIELPPLANTAVDAGGWPLDSGSHRINKVINQCREAIQSTGVKVK